MEILTLAQTQKLAKKILIVLYGSQFWKEILNFDALVRHGMISAEDLDLFQYADDPESAFKILSEGLIQYHITTETGETPAIAQSRDAQDPKGKA